MELLETTLWAHLGTTNGFAQTKTFRKSTFEVSQTGLRETILFYFGGISQRVSSRTLCGPFYSSYTFARIFLWDHCIDFFLNMGLLERSREEMGWWGFAERECGEEERKERG